MTARAIKSPRWLAAMAAAVAAHAILSLNFPDRIWTTSTGMAFGFAVMRWRWVMLGIALLLWLCAFGAIIWVQARFPQGPRLFPDQLCYSLRLVPYVMILARIGDGDEGRAYRLVDGAQAALLAGLILYLLSPSIFPAGALPGQDWQDRAIRFHDAGNVLIALLALIAIGAQNTPERRRFALALAALLTTYAVQAILVNHLVLSSIDAPPPGSLFNVQTHASLIVFLLVHTQYRGGTDRRASPPALEMMMPTAFCAASVAVAFVIGTPGAAILAGAAILLGGIRATLVQRGLVRLERFVAGILAQLPDAVCVVGADDRIVSLNPAAAQLFGADAVGRRFAAARDALAAADRGDGTIETGDGRRFAIAVAPLPADERLVRLSDVTRLFALEREREEALQFLGHDMRAPLASILTMLGEDGGSTGDQRLRRYARHGLRIADDFVRLARARTASLQRAPLDLADALAEAVDMAWPDAVRRDVRLVGTRDGECWIDGDRALLVRAIYNLLDNGIRFAPAGSTVHQALTIDADGAHILVTSPGPPLPEDRQAQPFARFGGGGDQVGLGLALVQAAGARHGGTAGYRRDGDANRFTIDLPLAELRPSPADPD